MTLSPKSLKIFKTCNLYLCFLCVGLSMAVAGPCLLDLQNLVGTDTQGVSYIFIARGIGTLLGSIVGGIILDSVRSKQTVMTLANFLLALSTIAIPWSRNLETLLGIMAFNALFRGLVDTGGNYMCLRIWESDCGPYYQALHLFFGVGGLIAPLIAAPFLSDYDTPVYSDNSNFTTSIPILSEAFLNYSSTQATYTKNPSDISYPFSIIGAFGLLVTISFLVVTILSPPEQRLQCAQPNKNNKSSLTFLYPIIFLNFLLICIEIITEVGYAQMLTTYVVKGRLKLSLVTGSLMTSAFWAAFTVMRMITVFVAIKVSSFALILFDLSVTLVGSFVLFFFSGCEWAIWLASVLLGIGVASFYPAAVAWLDSYINVTNKLASVFVVGSAAGEILIPFVISPFIDTFPDILSYVVPVSIICTCVVTFVLYLILRKRPKKTDFEKPPKDC